jgi:hypothetical protein
MRKKQARQCQKLQLHSSMFLALAPIKPSLAQSHKKNKCSSSISLAESLASLPGSKHASLLHILPYSPWQDHGVFNLKMKETGEITLFEILNNKDKEIESLRRDLLRVKAYVPDEAGSLASLPSRQRDTGEDLAHKIDYEKHRLQEYTLQTTSPVSQRMFNELKVYLSVSVV